MSPLGQRHEEKMQYLRPRTRHECTEAFLHASVHLDGGMEKCLRLSVHLDGGMGETPYLDGDNLLGGVVTLVLASGAESGGRRKMNVAKVKDGKALENERSIRKFRGDNMKICNHSHPHPHPHSQAERKRCSTYLKRQTLDRGKMRGKYEENVEILI